MSILYFLLSFIYDLTNLMFEIYLIIYFQYGLLDIGTLLGGSVHNQLEREVVPALDNALRMTGGTKMLPYKNNFSVGLWILYYIVPANQTELTSTSFMQNN